MKYSRTPYIITGFLSLFLILLSGFFATRDGGFSIAEAASCTPNDDISIVSDSSTQANGSDSVELASPHPSWTTAIAGASWIWDTEMNEDSSAGTNDSHAVGSVEFTKEFFVEGTPTGGSIEIATDNAYSVSINGNSICEDLDDDNWDSVATCPIDAGDLQSATNTLTIVAENYERPVDYTGPNPAGLLYALDAESQTCAPEPTGEIIAPEAGEVVSGIYQLEAVYDDHDEVNDDNVQWAVRVGSCSGAANTRFGNVDGESDDYEWDGATFTATIDTTSVATGTYCFVFNPTDDAGENDVRETVLFEIEELVALDYGDAPAPYPTLRADDGARHGPAKVYALGNNATQDLETDGQPSDDADGDDNDLFDDEDGITFDTALIAGEDATIRVHANSGNGNVNGWIDWNDDGDWDDEGEHVLNDWPSANGWATTTISVPAEAVAGETYARFRISTESGLSYTGHADDGEVEDYKVEILGSTPDALIDFGDAPDSYGTLLASNGARHVFEDIGDPIGLPNPSFNSDNRDAEADGIPSADAQGDDTTGVDDENGIEFLDAFVAGESAELKIHANTGGGYVNAWIDWDQNGVFDPEDQILEDWPAVNGWATTSIDVPADALDGSTYARFRMSVEEGVTGPTGLVRGGEVEDYQIEVDGVIPEPEVAYGAYCGDGDVNQTWEQCDGGESCTAQCLSTDSNQCTDLVLARVVVEDIEYNEYGDADELTSDIFLGGDQAEHRMPSGTWFPVREGGVDIEDAAGLGSYEDVPGLAVRRINGEIRTRLFGGHPAIEDMTGREHVDGYIEFWSWDGSIVPTEMIEQTISYKLENEYDNDTSGNSDEIDGGADGAAELADEKANFWLTTTTGHDGFRTLYSEHSPSCGLASVQICKYEDATDTDPLSGWQMLLLGNQMDTVEVGSDGATYSSEMLDAGPYALLANGSYTYRTTPNASTSDAAYSLRLESEGGTFYFGPDVPWVRVNDFPDPYEGFLGIMFADNTLIDWSASSSFNALHEYAAGITAATGTLDFKIVDNGYSDNSGSLTVDIYEGWAGTTDETGCVLFEDVPYGTYTLDEVMQKDWSEDEEASDTGEVLVNEPEMSFSIVNNYNGEEEPTPPGDDDDDDDDDFEPVASSSEPELLTTGDDDDDDDSGRSATRRSAFSSGRVLGAAITTNDFTGDQFSCPFLTEPLHIDAANDPAQVNKAKAFFNVYFDLAMPLNGMFDQALFDAVIAFQSEFADEVLEPWDEMYPTLDDSPTGYIYLTTLWKMNDLVCPGSVAFPDLVLGR